MDKCEADIDGAWSVIGIGDALGKHKGVRMRCWACHGQVQANPFHPGWAVEHFSHRKAFSGCTKSLRMSSTQPLHSEAIS